MGISISLTFTNTLWFFWYRSISLQVQKRQCFVLWVWHFKQPRLHSFHSVTNTHSRSIFTWTEYCSPSSLFSRTMNFSSSVQSCARIWGQDTNVGMLYRLLLNVVSAPRLKLHSAGKKKKTKCYCVFGAAGNWRRTSHLFLMICLLPAVALANRWWIASETPLKGGRLLISWSDRVLGRGTASR